MDEALRNFITVTGASEAVALEKLQEHEGDLNEAINAFFNQGEQSLLQPENDVTPGCVLTEEDEPSEARFENQIPFVSFRPFLWSPFRLFDQVPRVSPPRDVRVIPIDWKDKEDGSAPQLHEPIIQEIPADMDTGNVSEFQGNVIVEDDDIPGSTSTAFRDSAYAGGPIHGRDPRPGVPQITELPMASNIGGNDLEEEMLQAAIEASRREAEEANRRQQQPVTEDIFGTGSDRGAYISDDDELARAISLSLKTAEQEKVLRECQGLIGKLEPWEDNLNSFFREQGSLSMGRSEGLGSTNVVSSSQVKLDTEDTGRDGAESFRRWNCKSLSPTLAAERLLREQQDDEYIASLQADKERELKAMREAEDWCLREKAEERHQQKEVPRTLQEEEASKKASLPPEPPADDENTVTLLVRMPDGSRCRRRFLTSDRLQSLFNFIDLDGGVKPGNYKLVKHYPRRVFTSAEHNYSLNELGLTSKQEALFLELE